MPKNKRNNVAEDALEALKEDFVVFGKTRVQPWQAWLWIGISMGVFVGLLLAANNSGQFSAGEAAGSSKINIVSPNGGETFTAGSVMPIAWSTHDIGNSRNAKIILESVPITPTAPQFVIDIVTVPANTKSYSWTIPNNTIPGKYNIGICVLRSYDQCESSSQYTDKSDAPFSIVAPLTITTASLPNANVGAKFAATISATGGNQSAYYWGVTSGALPTGLTLSTMTACPTTISEVPGGCITSAAISGTPTTAGTYSFEITVKDGVNAASKKFAIVVAAPKYDLNADGILNNADVKIVADAINNHTYNRLADLDSNGYVDVRDLINIRGTLGSSLGNNIALYYDLTLDGIVNSADVNIVSDALNSQIYDAYADLDSNGVINANDLAMIQLFVPKQL